MFYIFLALGGIEIHAMIIYQGNNITIFIQLIIRVAVMFKILTQYMHHF